MDHHPLHTKKNLSFLLIATFLGIATFLPALSAPFFYNDLPEILHHPAVADFSRLLSFANPAGLWQRPLTIVTYQANALIGGTDPFGYHLVNIALHLLTAYALFRWARRYGEARARWSALLFLVHPLATSSVSYISGRGYVLGTLLTLLALAALDRGTRRGAVAALLLAVMACLTKPFFLVSLVLVAAAAWIPHSDSTTRRFRIAIPLVSAAMILAYLLIRLPHQAADALIPADLQFAAQPLVWTKILELLLLPIHRGFLYGAELAAGWTALEIASAHFLWALLLFALLWTWLDLLHNGDRLLAITLLWLLIDLLGLSVTPKSEMLAEWRLYPLLAPFSVFAVTIVDALCHRGRVPPLVRPLLLSALVVGGAAGSWCQNHAWQSDARAWKSFLDADPASLTARFNFASALAREGKLREAGDQFRAVLASWEGSRTGCGAGADVILVGRTWSALGWIALREGQPAQAIPLFREALLWDPAREISWRGLGKGLNDAGDRTRGLQAETMVSFIRMQEAPK